MGPPPFVVVGNTDTVQAWSVRRLPFEPKGWQLDFRSALRAALSKLEPSAALAAVYASTDADFCDVENVLLYNVGASSFSAVGTRAVRFERTWSHPSPPPQPLDGPATHHHRYRAAQVSSGWEHWVATRPLASWSGVPLSGSCTAARTWWSLRTTGTRTLVSPAVGMHLGMSLRIGRPSGAGGSLFNVMKPLLDGLVSAFHIYDGLEGAEVANRLAAMLKQPPADILKCLTDERWGLLGPRVLVRPYRKNVIWNPADERLVAVSVEAVPESATELSGELVEVGVA